MNKNTSSTTETTTVLKIHSKKKKKGLFWSSICYPHCVQSCGLGMNWVAPVWPGVPGKPSLQPCSLLREQPGSNLPGHYHSRAMRPQWVKEPVHQQAWYWPAEPEYSLSSIRRVKMIFIIVVVYWWLNVFVLQRSVSVIWSSSWKM